MTIQTKTMQQTKTNCVLFNGEFKQKWGINILFAPQSIAFLHKSLF